MTHCLTCLHWKRLDDEIVGVCAERELPDESYRFQFEHCSFYADVFKKLLDSGASFYKVQMVTGINRARVSAYVARKGLSV